MEKLLIGFITVLIFLACIPMTSNAISETIKTQSSTAIITEKQNNDVHFLQIVDLEEKNNSELAQNENSETINAIIGNEQETEDSDRNLFISIGSIILFGIFLLLPSTKLK